MEVADGKGTRLHYYGAGFHPWDASARHSSPRLHHPPTRTVRTAPVRCGHQSRQHAATPSHALPRGITAAAERRIVRHEWASNGAVGEGLELGPADSRTEALERLVTAPAAAAAPFIAPAFKAEWTWRRCAPGWDRDVCRAFVGPQAENVWGRLD